ncbi:YceI family protein [Sphingobacterium griseoflavum]|uniref:Lipid-binding protein n=1 Tax=Sphingobacterium griseoflavum TaxID=1474952 RepID=A0ABQ3HZH1_9SPHI|nr:YceI family protein [Sphingobacterium griseoflavum]GHE43400.1 lipid-binding protein [Sphingobacterium griseoflavum]
MKKTTLFLAIFFAITSALAQKTNFNIDKDASSIKWVAKKIVGGHEGTIQIKNGTLQTDKNKIIGGEFIIDMHSLVCTDAPKLTNHLKNEDFFDVSQYGTAKLLITKVDNSQVNPIITGNITIKGKTKAISFPAKVTAVTANSIEAEAMGLKINRLDFDIKYRSASFFSDLGNRAIEDEFTLDVKIKATK